MCTFTSFFIGSLLNYALGITKSKSSEINTVFLTEKSVDFNLFQKSLQYANTNRGVWNNLSSGMNLVPQDCASSNLKYFQAGKFHVTYRFKRIWLGIWHISQPNLVLFATEANLV